MTNTNNEDKTLQMESLRKTITSAEKTIQSAKSMLLQLEGKKRVGRSRKVNPEDANIVYGTFDGQIMIGDDGKQYPVPANYASKSKLIEGDMLKLSVDDGHFLYKQVGPIERKNLIGIASQDETGNYFVMAESRPYKILLASITYFKIEPGDEVVITVPVEGNSVWAAIENVLQKNDDNPDIQNDTSDLNKNEDAVKLKDAFSVTSDNEDSSSSDSQSSDSLIDEWMSDIEDIKKEIKKEKV